MKTDIEIARAVTPKPLAEIAQKASIAPEAIIGWGRDRAKIDLDLLSPNKKDGKLVLVTAISPTPAGEGKTTTTIGLGDGLNRLGYNAIIALREPSLGPCFGQKGGATGGGQSQMIPMEAINLHFTGDFHAIGAAHNLLAAALDNHLHWGNRLGINPAKVYLRRVVDMNDRALRAIITNLAAGQMRNPPSETGFDITVASEVMAIFCLATSLADLEARLANMIVAETFDGRFVRAGEIGVCGAMVVLLKDAFMPNLVQTLEHNPVLVHGGPFANIAHGCNSVLATKAALSLADYCVTEAGFGADLGAEKFLDIKCRQSGLIPSAIVLVATIRSLKMNGGFAADQLGQEDLASLEKGAANLLRHVENLKSFGVPVLVALNHFIFDTDAEIDLLDKILGPIGASLYVCTHWANGGAGTEELAKAVVAACGAPVPALKFPYEDEAALADKIKAVASKIYRAGQVNFSAKAQAKLAKYEAAGFGKLPVCIAKTQYSFSTDPKALGAPIDHIFDIVDVRLSAGAGFVVALSGQIMTMPGLPRVPAAEHIGLDENGDILGLS